MFRTVQMASKSSRGLKFVPFAGDARVIRQAKLSELVPLPLLVNVVITRGVGLERRKITVAVAVGMGVSGLTHDVSVGHGVKDGIRAAVWQLAALTGCAMIVPTAPGFSVGTDGVARDGTHAMMRASAVIQANNFVLRVAVIVSSSAPDRVRDPDFCFYFSTMMATYGKHRPPSTRNVIMYVPSLLGATASKSTANWSPGLSSGSSTRVLFVICSPLLYFRSSPATMVLVPV